MSKPTCGRQSNQRCRMATALWIGLWMVGLGLPGDGWTHNLDPLSMDRYSEILLGKDSGQFYYIVYYGAESTGDAERFLDYSPSWQVDPEKERAWLARIAEPYLEGVRITLNGERVEPKYKAGYVKPAIGHGGSVVVAIALVAEFTYAPETPRMAVLPLEMSDDNFRGPRSWMQARVLGLEGVKVEGKQPYEGMEPFNYMLLDNRNFLPGTRELSLKVTLPAKDAPPPTATGEAESIAYGPQAYADLAEVTPPSYGGMNEAASLVQVLLFGGALFLVAAAVIIAVRWRRQRSLDVR